MQKTVQSFLRWLGASVYGGFFPTDGDRLGMERYLEDLWHDAPAKVALVHTLLTLFVQFSPILFLRKCCLFSQLKLSDSETLQRRMLQSRFYVFRLIAYGVRGHAMVAALRYKSTRSRALSRPFGVPLALPRKLA